MTSTRQKPLWVGWTLAWLFVGACGGGTDLGALAAVGAAVASSAVSRAQGGCYATCGAGTECDPSTGLCEPIGTVHEQAPGGASTLPSRAPRETPRALPEDDNGAFTCRTASGFEDEVFSSSSARAIAACEELNGEPCTCATGGPETER